MKIRFMFFVGFFACILATSALAMQTVPDSVYPGLEYLLSLPGSKADLSPDKVTQVVDFICSAPSSTGMAMHSREKAAGGFLPFSLKGDLGRVVDYVYNPDIPLYVTMPSSVREQEWQTPRMADALRELRQALSHPTGRVVRGSEREVITPDTNTGGYYAYEQDRAVAVFSGPSGPVLISVSSQNEPSDVGRKGCVIGNDANWNYLYSEEKGLNKTGLGWVDSYMYEAHSVLVLVSDTSKGVVHVGSFKWLNAGWAGINMVKPEHIVDGMKRFASDFVTVLESAHLPDARDLVALYQDLRADSLDSLRKRVAPYLEAMMQRGDPALKSSPFKTLLASGEYLRTMSQSEMVKVLLQEHLKKCLGRESVLSVAEAARPAL